MKSVSKKQILHSVKSVSKSKRKTNWLLRGLIGVSLSVHLIIFMQITGIYQSRALSFIELTMEDLSKPFARDIPRPRLRPKTPERPREVKKLEVRRRTIPRLKPMKLESADKDLPDSLMEQISTSALLNESGLDVTAWDPGAGIDIGNYVTRNDYFEMVRLRIESHKEYPEMARMRYIEGRTTVAFLIMPDGAISELEIIKSSRKKALDQAAISAVRKASPFPRPPRKLFNGSIPMELTIVFEIT